MRHVAHTLRENVTLLKRDILLGVMVFMILAVLAFGAGYFTGRYEQMQIARGVLESLPDVNACFS